MIVLAVISTTIVASVGTIGRSIADMKKNDLEELTTFYVLKALEAAKSPLDLPLDNLIETPVAIYSLNKQDSEGGNVIKFISTNVNDDIYAVRDNFRCVEDSRLNVSDTSPICVSIKIEQLPQFVQTRMYKFTVTGASTFQGNTTIQTLEGFRNAPLVQKDE